MEDCSTQDNDRIATKGIGMLNLTPEPITLIAENGETATIEPSGYVPRVETIRHNVGCCYAHPCDEDGKCERYGRIPIIEEISEEIVFEDRRSGSGLIATHVGVIHCGSDLLLVTREVAEAAVLLKHTLSSRMAFATGPTTVDCPGHSLSECLCEGHGKISAYRALYRPLGPRTNVSYKKINTH